MCFRDIFRFQALIKNTLNYVFTVYIFSWCQCMSTRCFGALNNLIVFELQYIFSLFLIEFLGNSGMYVVVFLLSEQLYRHLKLLKF